MAASPQRRLPARVRAARAWAIQNEVRFWLALIVSYCVVSLLFVGATSKFVEGMSNGEAGVLVLDIFTGSAPVAYQAVLEPHAWLWASSWIVRVLSWVLIPTLIGIVVGKFAGRLEAEARIARFEANLQEVAKELNVDLTNDQVKFLVQGSLRKPVGGGD